MYKTLKNTNKTKKHSIIIKSKQNVQGTKVSISSKKTTQASIFFDLDGSFSYF